MKFFLNFERVLLATRGCSRTIKTPNSSPLSCGWGRYTYVSPIVGLGTVVGLGTIVAASIATSVASVARGVAAVTATTVRVLAGEDGQLA